MQTEVVKLPGAWESLTNKHAVTDATYIKADAAGFDKLSKQNPVQRICQTSCKIRNLRASYRHVSADVHYSYCRPIIHFVELIWLHCDHLTIMSMCHRNALAHFESQVDDGTSRLPGMGGGILSVCDVIEI